MNHMDTVKDFVCYRKNILQRIRGTKECGILIV